MFKNKKSIFLSAFGLLMAITFIPSFATSNVTLSTPNDKVVNKNDNDYRELWSNDGTLGEPTWSDEYRFGTEHLQDFERCTALFDDADWNVIKNGTFYLDLKGSDPRIRVCDGWWQETWTGDDIVSGNEHLAHNIDGTWTLTINFTGDPIQNLLDEHDLLITGEGYTPIRLYCGVPVIPDVIWTNETKEPIPNWGGKFRFSNTEHSSSEVIYAFPMDIWNRMKSEPFYIDVIKTDTTNIRITTGWWSIAWPEVDYNNVDKLISNGDGTYRIKIDFRDYPILDAMDDQHLLFTGQDYTLLRIYLSDTHVIDNNKKQCLSFRNNAYLTVDKELAIEGETVTVRVNKENEFEFTQDDLSVTYNDGAEIKTCELTQVDETTFTFIMPNYDVNIDAVFDTDFSVNFNLLGHGNAIEPQLVHFGSKIAKPEDPFVIGWLFEGWYQDDTWNRPAWDFNNPVNKNMTLFAKWTEDPIVSVVMKSNPDKTEFDIYQDLDLTGAKITVNTTSGITQDIDVTPDMVSGFRKGVLGEQTITVTYEGFTTTFVVKVVPHTVHNLIKINGQAPTLFTPGWKDYYECPICNKHFEDDKGIIEIKNVEEWKTNNGKIAQPPLGEVIGFGTAIIFGTIAIGLTIYYIVLRKKEIVVK